MNGQLAEAETGARICIAGMHRSGTSTVAQLLHMCGLYLGNEEDLFRPRPDNPEGFWENRKFVSLNQQIMEAFGAGWDFPLPLEPGWHEDKRIRPISGMAEGLLEEFDGHEPWGWKDPRNSLTMPFWTRLIPDLRVVICLRNPLEVAQSLRKRGNSSPAFSVNLWEVYYRRLLDVLQDDRYIVTHYQAYFRHPLAELRRLLDFLRMPASDQLVAHARSSALKDLRHHSSTTQQMLESGLSTQVVELYLQLCEQADWDHEVPSARMAMG